MKESLTFLFGSGISFKAEMPNTDEITKIVMEGTEVKRDTKIGYSIREEMDPIADNRCIPEILKLIEIIYEESKSYNDKYYEGKKTNYEDIYYLLNQISLDLSDEIENAAIWPFQEKIHDIIQPHLSGEKSLDKIEFKDLVKESLYYIKGIVRSMLEDKNKDLSYLKFLNNFNKESNYSNLNIFSLNHDLLLERYFNENKIEFECGFECADKNGRRFWNSILFEQNKNVKFKLYKLHGSVNWCKLLGRDGWYDEKIYFSENFEICIVPRNTLLLVGSFNKLIEYGTGIFTFLFYQFYQKLFSNDKLIISGYGFQDKGINNQICNWVYSNRNKRIVIIDPNPHSLKERSRQAISLKWEPWVQTKVLKIIEKGIEDTKYDEIKIKLNE